MENAAKMASQGRPKPEDRPPPDAEIFDRAHLARYTMESPELEREIIDLFLGQMPGALDLIRQAGNLASWRLAVHTLKGSAAAIGARRINQLASELEILDSDVDVNVKKTLVEALWRAVNDFRAMASRIYSSR